MDIPGDQMWLCYCPTPSALNEGHHEKKICATNSLENSSTIQYIATYKPAPRTFLSILEIA